MTSRVEAEGSTIDEAIDKALTVLGVSRDEARVEIVQDAKRGLFGLGGQPAKVAVSLRKKQELLEEEPPAAASEVASAVPPREVQPRAKRPVSEPLEAPRPERRRPPAPVPAAPLEQATIDDAMRILGEILAKMELDARVEPGEARADGQPILNIVTVHGALVIGRHGQTLDSFEYLLNRIIGKQEERGTRIVVDCEGYRGRHQRELEDTATRLAEKVRSRGKSQTMVPMNPRDRRIVHMALSELPDVVTRSVGQGYLRRVVIAPARGARAQSGARS